MNTGYLHQAFIRVVSWNFGVPYPIELIHILMEDVCVIVGIDQLNRFRAMIDCEGQ